MKEDAIKNYLIGYTARLALHIYDTHGYPCELFKKKMETENGYLNIPLVLAVARKHRDFVKKEKKICHQ